MQWFLFFLIGMPILELFILIQVGSEIGALAVFALLAIAVIAGVYLLKDGSLNAVLRMQQRMQQGELPMEEMAESFLLGLAGILFILPGFLSDVIACLLLIMPLRQYLARRFKPSTAQTNGAGSTFFYYQQASQGAQYRPNDAGGTVIDGEYQPAEPVSTDKRIEKNIEKPL